MYWILLSGLASGGELHIDARIPAAVYLDGQAFVELSQPGTAMFVVPDGEHKLVIMTNGNPTTRMITIGLEPAQLLVGRTGITVGMAEQRPAKKPASTAINEVEFRSTSKLPLMVYIDEDRHILAAGATKLLDLQAGEHSLSVRNDSGTAIFATGTLITDGVNRIIVQFSEGRVPEVSGEGAQYLSVSQ
jgi:hypothetical protein